MARATRSERRNGYDVDTRVSLLEDDADQAEMRQDRIEGKLDSIRQWLLTGAITFAGSAVLLGINIALQVRGS